MRSSLGKIPINKLSSLFFRMSAMASKFIIFTFLSKYFTSSEYGVYSLLSTTITISIFILGFDFYNYSIRNILLENKNVASKVYSSFFLYIYVYVGFLFIGYLIFNQIDYLSQNTELLILICITEHLNQEIYRMLLAFKKVLLANWFLFFRITGWSVTVLILILIFQKKLSLSDILLIWASANCVTLLMIAIVFSKTILANLKKIKFQKQWILKGLKVSVIFYLATIALKTIEYSNRYIVEAVLDESSAGIFSFYSNFSMIIGIYISTIVVSYELPDLIISSETEQFKIKLKSFKKQLIIHSLIASLVILVCMYPILIWQEKEVFFSYWPLIILLTLGAFLMNISLIYHYYLYINFKEKKILEIVVISGVINIISTYIFCKITGLYGAGFAFLLTGLLMLILRKRAADKKGIMI